MIGSSSRITSLGVEHRRRRIERLHVAVLADHRRHADRQVQVRRARLRTSAGTAPSISWQSLDSCFGRLPELHDVVALLTMTVPSAVSMYRNVSGARA